MPFCSQVWAQNDQGPGLLDGDKVMERIDAFTANTSNLIPDSITLQNIWASGPINGGSLGLGATASMTFFNKKSLGNIPDATGDFAGAGANLEEFPTNIPFLPAASVDFRWGPRINGFPAGFDFGLSGLYYDVSGVMPEGTQFVYWTAGIDMRISILQDGMFEGLAPSVFFIGGYFFNSLHWGFDAQWDGVFEGETRRYDEYVNIDFRTGAYFGALQVSKRLFNDALIPYIGYKAIICERDTDFEWGTSRSVTFRGKAYTQGMEYRSAGENSGYKFYHEVYGGIGILKQFITVGAAYNFVTEHLGLNLSLKIKPRIGNYEKTGEPKAARKTAAEREAERLAAREAELNQQQSNRQQEERNQDRKAALERREAEEREAQAEARRKKQEERRARAAERDARNSQVYYTGMLAYRSLIINGGIGIGAPLRTTLLCPPLMVSADYANPLFGLPFTLGGMMGFSAENGGGYQSDNIALAFRLAYHPNFIPVLPSKLDLYGGLLLGGVLSAGEKTAFYFMPGFMLGARYWLLPITDRMGLGVYAELGYSPLYIFSIGGTFKF